MKGTLPGHNSQGLYALLDDSGNVLYVGVGASLGYGRYKGHGIGSRVSNYRRVAPGQRGVGTKQRRYVPTGKWEKRGMRAVATLEFPADYAYLAYGLEAFLISASCPPYNTNNPAAKP